MRKAALYTIALGSLTATACVETEPDLSTGTYPIQIIPTGPSCADLGYGGQEFRVDYPVNGVYAIDAFNSLTFRYYDDSNTVFFYTNSTLRINAVMISAAGSTAVWDTNGSNGWPSLGLYLDGVAQQPESVSFCYDHELFLNPNGYAHYGVRQSWDIAKTGGAADLLLSAGQSFLAPYTVTLTPTGTTAESFFVEGPVFVNNRSPQTVTVDAVNVAIGEVAATVTCPGTSPYSIAPYTTLTCTFHADLPDDADRPIAVSVDNATGGLLTVVSQETASFADHTTSTDVFDACVAVYDDHVAGEYLGTACASGGVKTFTYTAEIGPYEVCGPFSVTNTAWYEGLDSGAGESATFTVDGSVPCASGCSLTPGYWKTHSAYGPARYDETWALLPGGAGADTPFFLSGQTYYQALWTSPAGNAYYILAHAYIAAELNQLNGADFTAAADAFAQATAIFQAYGPADPAFGKKAFVRTQALALATTLDNYNNGLIGPGHCSE
ncbi:MAG: hypothetical protein F9K40_19365 [Kofleriaceae bacterium]|nr:MAG: hypothetical protein F9K40_19365 [Kofleriaceae bacterium]MBZ0235363.1 hypothetical protein [Kofleriaceae bacterium]